MIGNTEQQDQFPQESWGGVLLSVLGNVDCDDSLSPGISANLLLFVTLNFSLLVSKDLPSGEDGGSTPWPPTSDSTSK